MIRINWREAVKKILPWLKEEMEKNGIKKRSIYGVDRKSIMVNQKLLMEKMGIWSEDTKNMSIQTFKYSFLRNILGKGFVMNLSGVYIDGNPTFVITQDPVVEYVSTNTEVDENNENNENNENCIKLPESVCRKIDTEIKNTKINEDYIRLMRHGANRKTISYYKKSLGKIVSYIKGSIDRSDSSRFVMSIEEILCNFG